MSAMFPCESLGGRVADDICELRPYLTSNPHGGQAAARSEHGQTPSTSDAQ